MSSLSEMTKAELLAVAEQFGTDAKSSMNKAEILALLTEDGVDDALIASVNKKDDEAEEDFDADLKELVEASPAVTEEPEEEQDLVLVRMLRANNTYQIRGYHFTREHPYALVTEKDADYLIEKDGGFRMASPKEAREYYS